MSSATVEYFQAAQAVGTEKHPRKRDVHIQYGTAGFRTKSDDLDHVLYRMGLLAVLRSKVTRATIGLMVTASHNPEPDNGVKLVDPHGEMLDQAWEAVATRVANVADGELAVTLAGLAEKEGIDLSTSASVFIGRDTRVSSPSLSAAAATGVCTLSASLTDHGVVTTPLLHYLVVCHNTNGRYGEASQRGYLTKITAAFKKLRGQNASAGKYAPRLVYDGANGVGALMMKEALAFLGDSLSVSIYNDGSGQLNDRCGADHVKVQQTAPLGVPKEPYERCVSVDGDADRIVYYYTDSDGSFHLLDGDRIATLVAGHLMQLVQASGLDLQLGLVQTAYANGNSTRYIADTLRVPVACVPTGVKHLHHRAQQFDVGVYFEANGHGTVVFSPRATDAVQAALQKPDASAAVSQLATLIDVVNQTVGDAISDMLLVETVLHARGWDVKQWEEAYTDLANRQMKVVVEDRRVIQTADAERKVVSPAGLQEVIEKLAAGYPSGRAFVRPSGTEDIVRVYAEAVSQADADALAGTVARAVHQMAGGVGDFTH